MRALSASFGVVTILLVYLITCELFAPPSEGGSAQDREDIRLIAALAALVFAVNLVTIKYSREARMYPLLLAAILAQITMFLRALRAGRIANYAGVAVLTALSSPRTTPRWRCRRPKACGCCISSRARDGGWTT